MDALQTKSFHNLRADGRVYNFAVFEIKKEIRAKWFQVEMRWIVRIDVSGKQVEQVEP
jgi:hypothetical protein